MKVVKDRILVRPIQEEQQSGNLIVVNSYEKGEVVSVGGDVKEVSVGDVVVFMANAALGINGRKILTENDVMIVEEHKYV